MQTCLGWCVSTGWNSGEEGVRLDAVLDRRQEDLLLAGGAARLRRHHVWKPEVVHEGKMHR